MNCPKCNDPIAQGEYFCGKCGNPLQGMGQSNQPASNPVPPPPNTTPTQPGSVSVPPAQTPNQPTKQGSLKKTLWIILGVVVVVILLAILWATGVFGGSAAVKIYVVETEPDFSEVANTLDELDTAINFESTGDVDKDLKQGKEEVDNISNAQDSIIDAERNLANQKVSSSVKKLDSDLSSFYKQVREDLDYRYEIANYFYISEKIGDDLARSSGFEDVDMETADYGTIEDSFQQLKDSIDDGIADLEDMDVPEVLKDIHESEIDTFKKLSDSLGAMVVAMKNFDDVGLLAAASQFDSLVNEYETKISTDQLDDLEPEQASLNDALEELIDQKDAIEAEYLVLKEKYRIK